MIEVHRIDLMDGKYTYIRWDNGSSEVLRHGEKWRDVTGDNLIYAMACMIEDLQGRLYEMEQIEDARPGPGK
jgi:hypothetical protein